MTRMLLIFATIVVALFGTLVTGSAQKQRGGLSITTNSDKDVTDCEQLRVRIGDGVTARAEETQTLPAGPGLRVRPPLNGGIHVQGWDQAQYSIKACMAAGADTLAEAQAIVGQLKLSIQNGEVTVVGPGSNNWVANIIILAPNGSTFDLSATNGPIGVSRISGTVQARSVNGPITFSQVAGTVKADVQNGPVTVVGGSGDFRLNAQNGPLTISLVGTEWNGDLEGHTQNGPLTVQLPQNYVSAFRVDE